MSLGVGSRGVLILRIEYLLDRLDVHDELTASALRDEFDATEWQLGLNSLKAKVGELEDLLAPYEDVGQVTA